mmetsp:Transcript_7848/g.20283  ORF Transcript_7848/g.20283 Transcript_7848/m.20283 type:complete len:239 (-) Transcript_7848:45-761(-)
MSVPVMRQTRRVPPAFAVGRLDASSATCGSRRGSSRAALLTSPSARFSAAAPARTAAVNSGSEDAGSSACSAWFMCTNRSIKASHRSGAKSLAYCVGTAPSPTGELPTKPPPPPPNTRHASIARVSRASPSLSASAASDVARCFRACLMASAHTFSPPAETISTISCTRSWNISVHPSFALCALCSSHHAMAGARLCFLSACTTFCAVSNGSTSTRFASSPSSLSHCIAVSNLPFASM